MQQESLYYVPSGRLNPLLTFLGSILVGGLLVAFALFYARVSAIMPIAHFNPILTILYGAIVGMTSLMLIRLGHIRTSSVLPVAAILGVFAVYFQWVFWFESFDMAAQWNPVSIVSTAVVMAEDGIWTIAIPGGEFTPTGSSLYLIRAGEALLIIGAAMYTGRRIARDVYPYCEETGNWTGIAAIIDPFDSTMSKSDFEQAVADDNLEAITSMETAKRVNRFLRLYLHKTVTGDCCYYLSVERITIVNKSSGQAEQSELYLPPIHLTEAQYNTFYHNWRAKTRYLDHKKLRFKISPYLPFKAS